MSAAADHDIPRLLARAMRRLPDDRLAELVRCLPDAKLLRVMGMLLTVRGGRLRRRHPQAPEIEETPAPPVEPEAVLAPAPADVGVDAAIRPAPPADLTAADLACFALTPAVNDARPVQLAADTLPPTPPPPARREPRRPRVAEEAPSLPPADVPLVLGVAGEGDGDSEEPSTPAGTPLPLPLPEPGRLPPLPLCEPRVPPPAPPRRVHLPIVRAEPFETMGPRTGDRATPLPLPSKEALAAMNARAFEQREAERLTNGYYIARAAEPYEAELEGLDEEERQAVEAVPEADASDWDPESTPRSRDQRRSRRKRDVRARTVITRRLTTTDLEVGRALYPEQTAHLRPKTRGECEGGPRPCPFVSCKWHLYLDVHERNGSIKLNFPDIEPHEMKESCVLDVAARGPASLEAAGEYLNMTRERIRQLEVSAMAELSTSLDLRQAAAEAEEQALVSAWDEMASYAVE